MQKVFFRFHHSLLTMISFGAVVGIEVEVSLVLTYLSTCAHLSPPSSSSFLSFIVLNKGAKKARENKEGFEILFLHTFILASEFCPLARGRAREDHQLQLKRRQDANKTFGDSDTRVRAEDIGASLSSEDRCLSRRSELVARVTCASLPSDRGRRLSRATAALCLCFSWKEGEGGGGLEVSGDELSHNLLTWTPHCFTLR